MGEIEVSRVIHASPERVWEVLTDVDAAPETLSGVTAVQRVTDGPYAVGFRWRETRTVLGRESTQELWVTDADPWRRTEVRAEAAGTRYVTEFTLTPLDRETRTDLRLRFRAEQLSPGPVARLAMAVLGRVVAGATRSTLEQDLADVAATAET